MRKITFITPNSSHGRGVLARCKARHPNKKSVHCILPEHHAAKTHKWSAEIYAVRLRPGEKAKAPRRSREKQIMKLDCLQMIEDAAYRKKLLLDLRERKLRPAVECMLWYYAKGKPKEMVEHSGTLSLQQELSALSPEDLRQRALDVAAMLKTGVVPIVKPSVH